MKLPDARPEQLDSALVGKLMKPMSRTHADFASYQTWTTREIPVVILDPR
ncbi:MAG TPA: hypothetical protein VFN67_02800 [Polyangiales bacterium]|nr:hypothetical protein [Polyangiales bacterium]